MSLVDDLGLDPDNLRWQDLGFCNNREISSLFYEDYESNPITAKYVDQICLHCPVIKYCYQSAKENKESGVWGGVYWDEGKIDDYKNSHKTKETWEIINNLVCDQSHKDKGAK